MIRKADKSDIADITQLHFSSQVSGILGKLSFETLRSCFYAPLIADRTILSTVETDEYGEIRGFIASRLSAKNEPFSLPNKNLTLIKELLSYLIRHPKIIFLVTNVLRTEKKVFQNIKKLNNNVAEIQILVVKKDSQGRGIGSQLIKALVEDNKESEIIVKTQSIKAVEFYKKHGFIDFMSSTVLTSTIFVLQHRGVPKDVN